VLLLAGCGQDAEPSEPQSLRDAIEEPDRGPPAEDLRELAADEFAPTALAALAEVGSVAFRTTTTTVGGQVPGTTELHGALRIHEGRVDQYSTGTGPAAAELVVLDDVLYMRSEQTGLGEEWLKMHLGEGTESMYGFAARAHDPVSLLEGMADPIEFEFEGPDEVQGVATHRYRVVISAEDYLAGLRMPLQMADSLPDEVSAQVWIDGAGHVRRVLQEIAVDAREGVEATTSTTDIHYSDHGIVVEIRPPDAADVTNEL
jgi:hypothetical protein